jgi:hypothetical protein
MSLAESLSGSNQLSNDENKKKPKEFAKWQSFIVKNFWLLSLLSFAIVIAISVVIMVISKAVERKSLKVPPTWKPTIENAVAAVQKTFWDAQNSQKKSDYSPSSEYAYLQNCQMMIDYLKSILGDRVKELSISVEQYESHIKNRFAQLQDQIPRNFHSAFETARKEFIKKLQLPSPQQPSKHNKKIKQIE